MGVTPLMPPRYLHLYLPEHHDVLRTVLNTCVTHVYMLSQKKVLVPNLPFLTILFYGGPLYSTCLA